LKWEEFEEAAASAIDHQRSAIHDLSSRHGRATWPHGADSSKGNLGILPAGAPAAASRRCEAASPYRGRIEDAEAASSIHNPQSAICNLQSAIHFPPYNFLPCINTGIQLTVLHESDLGYS